MKSGSVCNANSVDTQAGIQGFPEIPGTSISSQNFLLLPCFIFQGIQEYQKWKGILRSSVPGLASRIGIICELWLASLGIEGFWSLFQAHWVKECHDWLRMSAMGLVSRVGACMPELCLHIIIQPLHFTAVDTEAIESEWLFQGHTIKSNTIKTRMCSSWLLAKWSFHDGGTVRRRVSKACWQDQGASGLETATYVGRKQFSSQW